MNRTLKRPMFRIGGSAGTGITSGLDKPRKQYANGTQMPNFQPSGIPGFLTSFGLNLLATPPQGNIFQTAAVAARDPMARFDAAKARSAASRREIMAQLMGQQRQFEFDRDLQRERLEAQERIAGVERDTKEAIDNFPEAGNPVIAKKLNVILKSENAINAPGQIVPDGQNITKTIQNLNPDAGVVFALYNSLTGDVTKFVRVEKGKNNRVLLAEVDENGADLPAGEGDAPSEEEEFKGFPIYKAPPKENIFKKIEPQEAFDIDEPQA